MSAPLRIAVIGCGNIANAYAKSLKTRPELVTLHGATDVLPSRAAEFVARHGGKTYASIEAVLKDPGVDLVLNLTIHQAHYRVTRQALLAGKHVWSEKPLTRLPEDAARLVKLAKQKGVRLGSSPMTFMGEAQQTVWKFLREKRLGTVRMIYAEMNWGRLEVWHPNPAAFYQKGSGPLFDVGVYPLTLLTTFFGPVRRVRGIAHFLQRQRVTSAKKRFTIGTPDWVLALLEFAGGLTARLTASFYARSMNQRASVEIHGDQGALHLGSSHDFHAPVSCFKVGAKDWETVPFVRAPHPGVEWGRGLFDLAEAIRDRRPHRATGEQAAHVVEVCHAALVSAAKGSRPLAIRSRFRPPTPMEWARG
ncbi:MAG: Gfo/Idh/MocA family oxidoreductase [Verrucomicrobiae bacterium]|nr:Gfo/Idh/MocA family oxidoreductase [Verrucomicrobiae bacterium]